MRRSSFASFSTRAKTRSASASASASRSRSTVKCTPCRLLPVGQKRPASIIRRRSASLTASPVNCLMLRRDCMASSRRSGSNSDMEAVFSSPSISYPGMETAPAGHMA